MNAPHSHRRSSEVERQLAAIAGSRERSNRPMPAVLGAGVILLVALLILLWGVMSVASARSALSRERARAARWDAHLATIDSLSQSTPELSKLYPISSFIKSDLEKLVDTIWRTSPGDRPITIGDPKLKRQLPDSPIEEKFVECTSSIGVPLGQLMEFINGALEAPGQTPKFVSHLQLTPIQSSANWRATVRIGLYQVVKEQVGSAE